jgi:hypothetical protein
MKPSHASPWILTLLILLVLNTMAFGQRNNHFKANPTTDTYVDFGRALDISALDTVWDSDEITITLWMRWVDSSHPDVGNWANVFTMSDSSGSGDNGVFWIQHNSNNSKVEFAIHSTGRNYVQSNTNVEDSVWYHVTALYNGSWGNNNMRLYINGGQEASRNKTGNIRNPPNKTKLTMGRWPNPGNTYREFKGDIDEVSIWNRSLTQAEIDSIMVNPESVTGSNYDANGLIGYWDFDDSTANDKTSNHIDGIIFGGNPIGTLPVSLIDFNGFPAGSGVMLQWRTATEINNSHFEVQKSTNGVAWQTFQEITGAGNSNRTVTYTVEDANPSNGTNLYRLKQVDYDGVFKYSESIRVEVEPSFENLGLDVTMFQNQDGLNVMLMSEMSAVFELSVVSIQGQELRKHTDDIRVGEVKTYKSIDRDLPGGVYILLVRSQDLVWSSKFQK